MTNNTKISQYFKLADATASTTATSRGIANDMTPLQLENARELASNTLDPILENIGRCFVVSSWFRSEALNKAVGGVATSIHRDGGAADLVPIDMSAYELACKIRDCKKVTYNKLILEYKGGREWVHVQYLKSNLLLYDTFTYFGSKCYIGLHSTEPQEVA